jgi:MerR family transcriptional regulator/heat shock protein HspR
MIGAVFGEGADEDAPVFVISVAAQLSGLHAQTLRSYDRLGLVCPGRTAGGGRRYSSRDIAMLHEVQRLSQEEGINLAGVKRIIDLENQVAALRSRVSELSQELAEAHTAAEQAAAAVHRSYRHELIPTREQTTSLVVYRPNRRR